MLKYLYNLSLTLAIAVALLLPFHMRATQSVAVTPLDGGDTFTVTVPAAVIVPAVGDTLPVYRFFASFKTELGKVRVAERNGRRLACRVDTSSLLFPLGRQGVVVDASEKGATLDLGTNHGFRNGDRVNVFSDGRRVGRLTITDAGGRFPSARVVERKGLDPAAHPGDLVGMTVSEYTVLTSVVLPNMAPALLLGEAVFIGLVILLETLLAVRYRSSIMALAGAFLASVGTKLGKRAGAAWFHLATLPAGLAICYFIGRFAAALLDSRASLEGAAPPGARLSFLVPFGVSLTAYLVVYVTRKRFPPLWLWEKLDYRPLRIVGRFVHSAPARKSLNWLLHLLVVFAFASALMNFLSANINTMLEYLAPYGSPLRFRTASLGEPRSFLPWLQAVSHNCQVLISAGPSRLTFDQTFSVLRYGLWSLTIVGCLVGYVHSTVRIMRWTAIRNVDFTLLGWFTNAICYGPLLGGIFWGIVPSEHGSATILASGTLFTAMVLDEFLLNVLYTASIWNMFTRFGVMVDKGLVDRGFFALVRHPSYTLEAAMFFLLSARGLTTGVNWAGVGFFAVIYWLRSEREDVFMFRSNPDYAGYRQRVPWKFIPGLL